nr:hypothetical protein CFP56_18333 [Quercus suber]
MTNKGKKKAVEQARDKGDSVIQSQVSPSSSKSPTNEALVSSNSVINGGSTIQKKRGQGKAKGVYPCHSYKCEIHDRRFLSPKIFFEMTRPPTRGRLLGMGVDVKPRDVLIKILQINARDGDQNVDENREDDFEEENSQKEDNDSYDD